MSHHYGIVGLSRGNREMFSRLLGATNDVRNVESLTIYGPHDTFDLTLELFVDSIGEAVLLDKRDGDWYSRKDYGKVPAGLIDNDNIITSLNDIVKSFLDLTKNL